MTTTAKELAGLFQSIVDDCQPDIDAAIQQGERVDSWSVDVPLDAARKAAALILSQAERIERWEKAADKALRHAERKRTRNSHVPPPRHHHPG